MKFFIAITFVLILLASPVLGQWESPRELEQSDESLNNLNSLMMADTDNQIYAFWYEKKIARFPVKTRLYFSKSIDEGINWSAKEIIFDNLITTPNINFLNGYITQTGRIFISFSDNNHIMISYSDDGGDSWSSKLNFSVSGSGGEESPCFLETDSGLHLIFELGLRVYHRHSPDNGVSWSQTKKIFTTSSLTTSSPVLLEGENDLVLLYTEKFTDSSKVYRRTSPDSGKTWTDPLAVFASDQINNMTGIQTDASNYKLLFHKHLDTYFDNIKQTDIIKIESTNSGETWSAEEKFTNFAGNDSLATITNFNGNALVSFCSDRYNPSKLPTIWFGKPDETTDQSAPPYIYNFKAEKGVDNLSLSISAMVDDETNVDSVLINYSVNGNPLPDFKMYDDGLHNDSLANDKIYGAQFFNFNYLDELNYTITAFDDLQNSSSTLDQGIQFSLTPYSESSIIDVNKIKLPLNNNGVLADAYNQSQQGGFYDGKLFLYSSGFYLSGLSNNVMFGNGVLSASRVEDYIPGPVNSDPNSEMNKVYTVRESDTEFGANWQEWKWAVSMGAKFYDGNNDGIYNPIDINHNGRWDANEDRPDIQGDITAWCIFNDGVIDDIRRYEATPKGIEIKQTLFASEGAGTMYEDIIFVRYEITNTGTVADIIDSVYFSAAADPDLGDSNDDLLGYDSFEQSGYIYNNGSDMEYGSNPPAFFIKHLQGPPVFIAGETFIDNNNNNIYDDGVDTPLDSAFINKGKYLGSNIIPGAKNLRPNAFTQYMKSHPTHGDPDTYFQLRNYHIGGRGKNGDPIDPCTWQFGNGSQLSNCAEIDPKFMYSGDPVSDQGWINTISLDQRMILPTGPFQLNVNEPVELLYAYIVGRGTDHLNSITKAREISQFAQTVYDNNFQDLPTGINDDENLIVNDFKLYQNYPNPFNPVTTIKFSIPASVTLSGVEASPTKLIVFDLLGRKVKTLVNEVKSSGTYEVKFDASALSSGVYFYQLTTGKLNQTKKLMLLK